MTKIQTLRSISRVVFMAALAITPALAVDVTYSTTGTFTSSGTSTFTGPHGLSIVFTGTAADFPNVNVPPTSYAPFGTFTATGPSAGFTDTVTDHFTLQITQTSPAPGGTETLVDNVSGTIKVANSGVTVTFDHGSGAGGVASAAVDPLNNAAALKFVIPDATHTNDVTYWVDDVTPIHPQTGGGSPGVSIINGAVDSTVPEPTFYTLTGTGFAGLLLMTWRRRRQNA